MSQFPDFSRYGFFVKRELSQNRAGGRVTYLAIHVKTGHPVVIKQFQFTRSSANWSEFDAYKREIQTLRGLKHPGIPRYLGAFQSEDGFCMVQEYKRALSLASPRSFSPAEIRQIAIAILDILVYLQRRLPPVIHRDIKPENILVDEDLNVYLVDFGFARVGHGEVGVSSVVKGTLGFMPPEQIFNRELTTASDLYGLGVTIICLLTATKSTDVGDLIDITYKVNLKPLSQKISPHWVRWLEKMVEPRVQDRFSSAEEALAAIPGDLVLPQAILAPAQIVLTGNRRKRYLTDVIALHNAVPQTELQGNWEIVPHPSDPPEQAGEHAWITIEPQSFVANQASFQVTVDTQKLMSNKTYRRQLLLHTNAFPKTYTVDLHVQTAPLTVTSGQSPYSLLALLLGFSVLLTWALSQVTLVVYAIMGIARVSALSAATGVPIGLLVAAWILTTAGAEMGGKGTVIAGVITGVASLLLAWTWPNLDTEQLTLVGAGLGMAGGAITGLAIGAGIEHLRKCRFAPSFAVSLALLTVGLGTSLGLAILLGLLYPPVLVAMLGTGIPLMAMVLQLPLQNLKRMNLYRQAEQRLIKP
jgi:serine/threonine protein kinase